MNEHDPMLQAMCAHCLASVHSISSAWILQEEQALKEPRVQGADRDASHEKAAAAFEPRISCRQEKTSLP